MAEKIFMTGLMESLNHKAWEGTTLKNNEILVDTSGFVPLDIRLKKLDIAAAQRKLALAAFDYHESQELFDDDVIFSPYDDLDDLQSKLEIYTKKKNMIMQSKAEEFLAAKAEESRRNAAKSQTQTPTQNPINMNSGEKQTE